MFKTFLTFLVLISPLQADLATADRAMADYAEKLKRWERSFTAAETSELKSRILSSKPEQRPVSESLMREISPVLNEPSAMNALSWIYKNDPSFFTELKESSPGKVVRNSLNRYHYKFPGAGELCISISQNFHPSDMAFLEKVSAQSPNKEDQGLAALSISIALSNIGDEAALLAKRLEQLKKAITLLPPNTVVEGQKASDIIDDQIYVIKNLTKGRNAPSISGQDISGRTITWAAGTGKVTALVFWTDKNSAQDSLLPVLQDTAKLLKEVGGEMIGIYTGDQTTLRTLVSEQDVTWRNLFDQNQAITQQYRISQTPTVFVLDKQGRIQSISEPNALVNLSIRALANTTE